MTANRKRDQILRAARELFVDQGFSGTSMDAVVAHAGVSKQTLYRYFPSKTELLGAALLSALPVDELSTTPVHPPADLAELRSDLLDLAGFMTQRMTRPDVIGHIRLLFGEAFRLPELRTIVREGLPNLILQRVSVMLRAASTSGVIHTLRPDLSARLFVGSMFSFVAIDGFLREEPLPPPTQSDLTFLVDAFLATVKVPQEP